MKPFYSITPVVLLHIMQSGFLVASLSSDVFNAVEQLENEEDAVPEAVVGSSNNAAMPHLEKREYHHSQKKHRHSRKHKSKNGAAAAGGGDYEGKVFPRGKSSPDKVAARREQNVQFRDSVSTNEFYARGKRNTGEMDFHAVDTQSDNNTITYYYGAPVPAKQNGTAINKYITGVINTTKEKDSFINEVASQIRNQTPTPTNLEVRIKYKTPFRVYINLPEDDDNVKGRIRPVTKSPQVASTTTTTTQKAAVLPQKTIRPSPTTTTTTRKTTTRMTTSATTTTTTQRARPKVTVQEKSTVSSKKHTDYITSTPPPPPSTSPETRPTSSPPMEIQSLPLNRFGFGMKDIKLVQTEDGMRPEAKTKSAIYRGLSMDLESGKKVYAFYGISYAAPPVGKLRFKRSSPAQLPSRDGVFEATRLNAPCFPCSMERTSTSAVTLLNKKERDEQQVKDSQNYIAAASEDCLYLNMWLPEKVVEEDKTLYPVLVWIHGEGFLNGMEREDYKTAAEFVAKTEIIVVTIQYRLGVFGFLHMNSTNYSGNAGLHDQVQALKWIEENIESFGGDPHAVTLMGHDIGAAFVGYHLVSKVSPGYFKRSVMIGGTLLQPHVFHSKRHANQMAMELATQLGCVNSKSIKSILSCLQNMDPVSIWEVQVAMQQQSGSLLALPFVPTEDGVIVPGNPTQLLASGRGKMGQILVGGSSNEGSFVLASSVEGVLPHNPNPTFISYDKFLSIIHRLFSEQFSELEMDAILHQYKNWANLTDGYANQIRAADAVGDFYFTCPMRKFSDFWSARGLPTYHFTFSLQSSVKNRPDWMGAVHGDELDYIFGVPLRFPNAFSKEEVSLSGKVMKILENFIKTGNLHENWERYGKETPHFAEFSKEGSIYGSFAEPKYGPRMEQCAFWNELFPKIALTALIAGGNSVKVSTGASSQYDLPNLESPAPDNSDNPNPAESLLHAQSFNVDENCYVALHNCSRSNFAIYVN